MIDAAKMRLKLAKRFDASAWALLFEVKDAVGYDRRRADALAISCWKSRGLHIHGIEIKVHRSDWLRELKKPAKSAPVQRYCHFWWIAAPKGIVAPDELPETWGLLEPQKGGKLVATRKAPKLDPDPPDMAFVAELGRRMTDSVARATSTVRQEIAVAEAEKQESQEYKDAYEIGQLDAAPALRDARNELQDLQRQVSQFEKASGLKLNHWNAGDVGATVAIIQRQRLTGHDTTGHAVDTLERTLKQLRTVQKALAKFRGAAAEGDG